MCIFFKMKAMNLLMNSTVHIIILCIVPKEAKRIKWQRQKEKEL